MLNLWPAACLFGLASILGSILMGVRHRHAQHDARDEHAENFGIGGGVYIHHAAQHNGLEAYDHG